MPEDLARRPQKRNELLSELKLGQRWNNVTIQISNIWGTKAQLSLTGLRCLTARFAEEGWS